MLEFERSERLDVLVRRRYRDEVLPAGQRVRSSVEQQLDALARLDPADHRDVRRRRRPRRAARSPRRSRGRRSSRPAASGTRSRSITQRTPERRARWPASTARPSERSSIAWAAAREALALVDPDRRPDVAAAPERGAGCAERARDDEQHRRAARRARPGTRAERPTAVTLSTTVSARRSCRRRRPGRRSRRCPRRARARPPLGLGGQRRG